MILWNLIWILDIQTPKFTNILNTSIFPPYYIIYHLAIKNRSGYLFQHRIFIPLLLSLSIDF